MNISPVAKLVWDNVDNLTTPPPEMGKPREDQLMGSPIDQLVELAGRVCYDSMGRGRSSLVYHEHIREVGHHSVLRHPVLTFAFDLFNSEAGLADYLGALIGRPGVQLTHCDGHAIRFTCNLQHAVEWQHWRVRYPLAKAVSQALGRLVLGHFGVRAPLATGPFDNPTDHDRDLAPNFGVVKPLTDDEVHASLFISCVSRVSADELLRHSLNCSPSVRSTRFCPEDKTPWILHPVLRREGGEFAWCREQFQKVEAGARALYNGLRMTLEKLLIDSGMDARRAHKQALGAARGVLGLSLGTEMVFSLSLTAAKSIFALRLTEYADDEIAEYVALMKNVLAARFPGHFEAPAQPTMGEGAPTAV